MFKIPVVQEGALYPLGLCHILNGFALTLHLGEWHRCRFRIRLNKKLICTFQHWTVEDEAYGEHYFGDHDIPTKEGWGNWYNSRDISKPIRVHDNYVQ